MMAKFLHGTNLGGWLSQCDIRPDREHFDTFITRNDIRRIAAWGFDHIRLPVDSTVFILENGEYDQSVLGYIDKCIDWCREAHLGILLDMHRLPGYNIATPLSNDLFVAEDPWQQTVQIWLILATRYLHIGEELRFELLNEPEWPCGYPVNAFYSKLISEIRRLDTKRVLIVGGNHYYHVNALEAMQVYQDQNVIYTFHYYEPNLFTNQLHDLHHNKPDGYPEAVLYPGRFSNLQAYLEANPNLAYEYGKFCWVANDNRFMEKNMQRAIDFQIHRQRELYMGEFGVSYYALPQARCAWMRDVMTFARTRRIGWCYWTYKEMDYGLVNKKGEIISQDVLSTLQEACSD